MKTVNLSRWFANYFQWGKLKWSQRKAAIRHRRNGMKGGRWAKTKYRKLSMMESVPANAQVLYGSGHYNDRGATWLRVDWRCPHIIGTRINRETCGPIRIPIS